MLLPVFVVLVPLLKHVSIKYIPCSMSIHYICKLFFFLCRHSCICVNHCCKYINCFYFITMRCMTLFYTKWILAIANRQWNTMSTNPLTFTRCFVIVVAIVTNLNKIEIYSLFKCVIFTKTYDREFTTKNKGSFSIKCSLQASTLMACSYYIVSNTPYNIRYYVNLTTRNKKIPRGLWSAWRPYSFKFPYDSLNRIFQSVLP